MATVMETPAAEFALLQSCLVACTAKIVHPNLPPALTEVSIRPSSHCRSIAQAPAHDIGVIDVPSIVADCAPLTTVIDLNTTFKVITGYTVNKTDGEIWKRKEYMWACRMTRAQTPSTQLS